MKEEASFERRALLLDAALCEFAQHSFDETSLNAILKRSGVSKGSFYYHFADKEELYLNLVKQAYHAKWEFISVHLSDEGDSGRTDLFEQFRTQAALGVRFAVEYPLYHQLSVRLREEKGHPIYERITAYLNPDASERLKQMIMEAAEAGDFRKGVSLDFLVRTLEWLFTNFDEIYINDHGRDLNEMLRELDRFVDMLRYGVGADENANNKEDIG